MHPLSSNNLIYEAPYKGISSEMIHVNKKWCLYRLVMELYSATFWKQRIREAYNNKVLGDKILE